MLESIKLMAEIKRTANFEKCVEIARKEFQTRFCNTIKQLVHTFPEDYIDKEGNAFWSGPKRFPHAIEFDSSDPIHLLFVKSAANLIAENVGLEKVRDDSVIRDIADKVAVETFKPREGVKIQVDENAKEDEKEEDNANDDDFQVLDGLL